jgi:hypothetical protein
MRPVHPLRNALLDAAIPFLLIAITDSGTVREAFVLSSYVFVACYLFWRSYDSHLRATNPDYRALARIRDMTNSAGT